MKKIPIYMAMMILLFVLAAVEAQKDKDTAGEVTTQTATTSDGRKVILKSDGTWEYYKETPPPFAAPKQTSPDPAAPKETLPAVATPKETSASVTDPKETPPAVQVPKETTPSVVVPKDTSPGVTVPKETSLSVATPYIGEKGILSFEARVVSKSGNPKPIADGTFYLLNDDLNRILQTSGLKPEKRLSLLNTFSMANYGSSQGVERSAKAFASAMESVKPHIVATTTSDSNGNGQFSSLVPGTYYLMNVSVIYFDTSSLIDRKPFLWNLKMQIRAGQNSTTLDEKNAVP